MMEKELKHFTVLVVDDSKIVQQMIYRALQDEYRVVIAENAVDALPRIYHEDIDLVLLDVLMPDIDGLELCRAVRSMPKFQQLPIIMLTSRDSTFDRMQGRMAGATEYLTKPVEAEHLKQVMARHLITNAQ